ncbi:MAG: CarD family transcriptional regulator [Bacillota bacterium]|nr:CarD family transcriptional regulator [Bacillota bacterium]
MFRVGDKIVHPMHGAGIVDEIVTRKVNGVLRDYYSLRLPVGGMLVMIPTENCGEIGVRAVLTAEEAQRMLGEITQLQVELEPNWNQRYRENMLRLKSGNLLEVAKVVKCLLLRDSRRGLSTGERKMLHSARQILISEIGMACDISYEEAERRINQAL